MIVDRPGFADPVHDSQTAFRAVLDAMSEPGRVVTLGAGLNPPAPLDPATAALLLTLADGETPLWLDPALDAAKAWITFHCGSPYTTREKAMFAVSLGLPDLRSLNAGTHEAPEQGATLIVQLPAIGTGRTWCLSGPGLENTSTLQATGLPEDFVTQWACNAAGFPRGIDLVLCAGQSAVALPRTMTVA